MIRQVSPEEHRRDLLEMLAEVTAKVERGELVDVAIAYAERVPMGDAYAFKSDVLPYCTVVGMLAIIRAFEEWAATVKPMLPKAQAIRLDGKGPPS